MNHFLVAGGNGFIGTNLVRRLINDREKVTVIDNCMTSDPENLAEFRNHPNFMFYEIDIKDLSSSPRTIDYVINLACPASPIHYQRNPIETMMTNVVGTEKLLNLAYNCGARFLQASTSEVYGDPLQHPQKEEYLGNVNCYGPRACYDEGKRAAESLVHDYWNRYRLDTRIMRIFNTYGPWMSPDDGRVVSNFIVAALRNEPITIYGTGTQTRSFCYVDDLVEGLMRVLLGSYNKPINVGNPKEFNMAQLASIVLELTGSKSRIDYFPLPKDDPKQRRPDITKMREMYHWEPVFELEQGLIKTIEYFAKTLEIK